MLGYGRFDQPEGTWSDDTSMMLCTMESLCRKYDLDDMAATFCKWLFEAYWTPTGYVFDVGLTTFMALDKIRADGISARSSGGRSADDNGNGSLMRILPAALFFADKPEKEFLDRIHEISAITHAHPRSQMGCGLYCLLVRSLLNGVDKTTAYRAMIDSAVAYYAQGEGFDQEMAHYDRVLSGAIASFDQKSISSSGYIIDTLEASLWCFLCNNTASDIILAAVNLGLDTDTTGMVAGGLAGLAHGLETIPPAWLTALARKPEIDTLVDRFAIACAG
jgi:ADP-ribosyl-[dinitrogen reductase] hydrolase